MMLALKQRNTAWCKHAGLPDVSILGPFQMQLLKWKDYETASDQPYTVIPTIISIANQSQFISTSSD